MIIDASYPLGYFVIPDRRRTSTDHSLRHLTDEQLLAESIAALTYLTICREEIARRNLGRRSIKIGD